MKVLISDNLSEKGVEIFKKAEGLQVDVKTGLTPDELKAVIKDYDGLVIRSATKVTAEIIQMADKLKVVGRAGIGLDNVDIPAASQRGIVVMNTPEGNTITTAEHTMAMIMSLSRNIPQATAFLKEGKWEKKKLQGSDYITIHTPKTKETANMINKDTLAKMKKGAMLINCARGGIVNEDDLYDALESGHLAGAAFDVFSKEPPGNIRLMSMTSFICTPHLGASTKEAQENVSRDVAEQITAYLLHGTVKNAVNVPSISPELMMTLRPYVTLVEKMGSFQTQLVESGIGEDQINYSGKVTDYDLTPLTNAMLKGLLTPILKDDVNFINSALIASKRGIKVIESKTATSDDFASLISLKVKSLEGENIISGTIFGRTMPRILRINEFYLEAIPEGHNLLIHNLDVPGMIGRITTVMGNQGINISRMAVSQKKAEKQNVILLTTDTVISDKTLEDLSGLENIFSVRRIEL